MKLAKCTSCWQNLCTKQKERYTLCKDKIFLLIFILPTYISNTLYLHIASLFLAMYGAVGKNDVKRSVNQKQIFDKWLDHLAVVHISSFKRAGGFKLKVKCGK